MKLLLTIAAVFGGSRLDKGKVGEQAAGVV